MRAEFNQKTRKSALARAGHMCEGYGPRYGLSEGTRCCRSLKFGVRYDHCVPDALYGLNDLANCRAVCPVCHDFKTAKVDVPQIRKADRQKAKNNGTWVKQGRPLRSQGFPKTVWEPSGNEDNVENSD